MHNLNNEDMLEQIRILILTGSVLVVDKERAPLVEPRISVTFTSLAARVSLDVRELKHLHMESRASTNLSLSF
jgi:hypothetical protein